MNMEVNMPPLPRKNECSSFVKNNFLPKCCQLLLPMEPEHGPVGLPDLAFLDPSASVSSQTSLRA
jgi:hypothetical protein